MTGKFSCHRFSCHPNTNHDDINVFSLRLRGFAPSRLCAFAFCLLRRNPKAQQNFRQQVMRFIRARLGGSRGQCDPADRAQEGFGAGLHTVGRRPGGGCRD